MASQDGLITFQAACELALPSAAFTEPEEEAILYLPEGSQASVPRGAASIQKCPQHLPLAPAQKPRSDELWQVSCSSGCFHGALNLCG